MKERFLKLKDSAVDFWTRTNKRQRLIAASAGGALALLILAALTFAMLRGGQQGFEPLFTNLEAEDASAIVQELKTSKTAYKLEQNGKAILVDKKIVYEKRNDLAAKGLPSKSTVGYELFDTTRLGVTDFTQKVNLKRAIEGEISRTIINLDAVEQARVMIVQPEPSLFVVDTEQSTASVALQLVKGKSLTEDQVSGIVRLVSSSVEGLDPKNVIVVDSQGNILSEFDEKKKLQEKMKLTELQLRHKALLEDIYQKKIYSALSKVFGEDNTVVVVSIELDFDTHEIEDEVYSPVVGDSGIVRSEQLIDEKYLGTGTVPEIGVPGTTSNIPGYKGLAEGNAEYSRSEETRNYEISRRLDKTQKNQGDIRMMSVAVMLNDEGIKYGEETYLTRRRIMEIRENVVSAANLNEQRGDKVSVVPIRFMQGEPGLKDEYIFNQRMETVKYWTRVGLIIFLILLAIIISLLAMRTWVVREELPPEPEFDEETLEEPVPVEELLVPELSDEQRMREKIKEEVMRMIHDDPEGAALIVRSWLFQDTD